jgi:murein DD-endopeptidase MepM/ murein hydrolase activator NlpD
MPPLHHEPGTGAARRRLAALLVAAGVVLTLGPGSAVLAGRVEQVARAAQPGGPAAEPTAPGPPAPGLPGSRVPPLRMPLGGPLVRGFEVQAGTYGPGHRGVDVGGRVGEDVRAPAGGRVEFAGPVAGVTWVSLLVAPGVTVTVGPLLDAEVTAGRRVRSLARLGRLGPGHGTALHLSLRVDGAYLDPLPYLLDRPRPRLAPLPRPGGLANPGPRGP